MNTIEVDDEVFAYLESRSTWGDKSPNQTLRRLLGLGNKKQSANQASSNGSQAKRRRKKGPKTDLSVLIREGLLRESQRLYLHDYQGTKLEGYEASVTGKNLLWDGQLFSMSDLARIFLQQVGYTTTSVRGPAHWYTADGVSVKDLWRQYLVNN